ncbi:ABC transporter permease [Alicyclobacillus acidoterrestris]|uniref:ECF transporter S component n=1 Tax=Alicyclobacillus suci TaxID=2816080 RepID=UPI0011969D79|nr:ECF transporter S component [Alicyclobacillus suci]GEO25491.1 ABC transporter permease [Alicyclobacillus acidoterrestris]
MTAWKLRDVIVMVVLAIVTGALYKVWDILYAVIPTTAYAGQATMTGLWLIASVLVAYIIRRPGAALLAELIAASVELLLGGQWGLSNLVAGLIQGIGAELAFCLFFYRGYHIVSCILSGVLASAAAVLQWYFQYGGNELTAGTEVAYIVIALCSGAVLGGILPKLVADALYKAGVLRNFAIARQRAMAR